MKTSRVPIIEMRGTARQKGQAHGEALASEEDPANPVARRLDPSKPNIIGYTAGTVIYELSDQPVLHFAAGPPSVTPFQSYRLAAKARDAA